MKLKALKPRLHNVIFHTHTVSGIVIGFALFICFYAGAFALFLDEMYRWENPEARFETVEEVDFDGVLQSLRAHESRLDINERFSLLPPSETNPQVVFYGVIRTSDSTTERYNAYIHPLTHEITPFTEPKTHMARTIYELHFFYQIPRIGIYLAGLVGFFFLFAIITGLLIHWKDLASRFYAFTVKGKWKQIWANGHTVLGFLTLPFQTIYALTGALLGISILLIAPSAFLLFNGDTNEIIKLIRPDFSIVYEEDAPDLATPYSLNRIYDRMQTAYPEHEVLVMFTKNYGKEDGTVSVRVDDHQGLTGDGNFLFKSKTGELLSAERPYEKTYTTAVYPLLIKLHYATFGGLSLKIIYFILAMMVCFIISSGVMIWYNARKTSKYTPKQRRFQHRVTKVYLALTQGLFPAVALIFLANKLVPMDLAGRVSYVNGAFFLGWLLLILIGLRWNNLSRLNRNYLFIGGILGLLIPLANGLVTGDWMWQTFSRGQFYVFSVDLCWLIAGAVALYLSQKGLKPKDPEIKEPALAEKPDSVKAPVVPTPPPKIREKVKLLISLIRPKASH
ncbi:MAG: PepSY-associated TM helix domain-containing protein [Bacteroidota bacterium]